MSADRSGAWVSRLLLPALLLPLVVGRIVVPGTARATEVPQDSKRELRRCATCHATEPNVHKCRPSPATLYGRAAASVKGFGRYSNALRRAGVVRTRETLDAWLRDPKVVVPGNAMIMRGIADARLRLDVIAHLSELAAGARSAGSPVR